MRTAHRIFIYLKVLRFFQLKTSIPSNRRLGGGGVRLTHKPLVEADEFHPDRTKTVIN